MYKDFRCVEQQEIPENKECKQERPLPGVVCSPVMECPEERVCHREICHEVPQE